MSAGATSFRNVILQRTRANCEGCRACSRAETRKAVLWGRGAETAPYMIVGAFPGPLEDKNRAPFSGPTGKLIERLAKALRLDPARDLFFTQVVRCFDGSAEPALTPEHVEACRPWLVAQIETIRPRVILALGEVPLRWFTGGVGDIEAMRGQWISWRGFDVMPTVMPQSWMDEATLARCRAEWRLAASRKWSADGAVWHGRGALNGRE